MKGTGGAGDSEAPGDGNIFQQTQTKQNKATTMTTKNMTCGNTQGSPQTNYQAEEMPQLYAQN